MLDKFKFLSWNVLFRQHEERYNPDSEILRNYPNEVDRFRDIINFIREHATDKTVVCLQECSKELLEIIVYVFTDKEVFYSPLYLREEEYLITITQKGFVKENVSLPDSIAKGVLVVSNDHFFVVNCHLIPQRHIRENVFAHISKLKTLTNKPVVVLGDFNSRYKQTFDQLRDGFMIPYIGKTYKRSQIDYIILDKWLSIISYSCELFDLSVSDHKPIMCNLTYSRI